MSGKVIIAGAGLGGLAAASCLMQAGFDVEVYEQSPVLGEVGAGIQVSANAFHVMRHLGVGDRLLAVGVRPGAYVFRLHDSGEELQRFALSADHERKHGAPYVQLHRADFHEILAARAQSLKPDLIRLNHRLTGFTETADHVEARFENGQVARGDLLIGADGLKSAVRKQICGDAPATYTGDAVWRLAVPVERLPKPFLEPVMSVFMGPGNHAVCYYLRAGTILNFVGVVETDDVREESWTLRLPWDKLKADFAGWHPAIQTVIDCGERDGCYRWSLHVRPPIRNWSTRRATLLGDAAHPTLPYLAQGAAMAIEDGAVLARALTMSGAIGDALNLYERNRVDRTARIVEQSSFNRRLFHLPSVQAMRDAFANRDEGEDRNTWLYSYNPLTVALT
jgi:salicylate hydroxylase